ncbi:hypothetical protein GRI97_09880 [Altererythrobacter xixiisoli]|uniref:Uncharacterized protein n=2 Tax=Croceibacterium xixiisoli TaxID=1476466 RepID=A0A6I4TWW1_9SPHN|nr:hypothetical protein [Croceibacterium xixiisoli]
MAMILIGIAPLASVALAGVIADLNGCGLHEGFAQPCSVLGADIGGVLYTMTTLGWLMLISLFFLAGGLLGLAGEALGWALRRIRGR